MTEISDLGQGQHGMPIGAGGHMVNEVDNAILQSAGIKAIHHVEDEGTFITLHAQTLVIGSLLKAPELVASAFDDATIKSGLDVDECAALDQLSCEIFHGQRGEFLVRHGCHDGVRPGHVSP